LVRLSILFVLATLVACSGGGGGGDGASAAVPNGAGGGGGGSVLAQLPNNVAGFAYVANNASDNVSAYTIDATTGVLSEVAGSPFAAGTDPSSVSVDPSGKFAYVANAQSASVSAYSINTTTGVLSEVPGSPFDAGAGPFSITTTRKIQ